MVIKDWRGKNIDISFNDDITKISGKNEVGKTTLINAWNWVFTSYTSSTATKNEELFDNRVKLSHETPTASVTLHLTIDNDEHVIMRTAEAKFTRPQGSAEYVKAPTDTYTISVDGFSLAAKEFVAWVEDNICPYSIIPFILDGSFFTTMAEVDRAKARKALDHVVGDISAEDYLGDYSMITALLGRCTVEQLVANSNAEHRKLKNDLLSTTSVLNDAKKRREDMAVGDVQLIEDELNSLEKDLERIDGAIAERRQYESRRKEISAGLAEKKALYAMRNASYVLKCQDDAKMSNVKRKLREHDIEVIKSENKSRLRKIGLAEDNIALLRKCIFDREEEIHRLKDKEAEVEKYVYNGGVCPHCGQPMPKDIVSGGYVEFQAVKDREVARIRKAIADQSTDITHLNTQISELEQNIKTLRDNMVDVDAMVLDAVSEVVFCAPFEQTTEGRLLQEEIDLWAEKLKSMEPKDDEALVRSRKAISNRRDALLLERAKCRDVEDLDAKIKRLTEEQKSIGANIVYIEGVVAKAKELIEERAQIISERVNGKLNGYKVLMYSTQKDGTKVPDCVVVDDKGVKFATLSNSARIRANLQMQSLFRRAFGVCMPTWIDECSIFDDEHLPQPEGQTIYLFAGNSDNLVVE